MTDYPDGTLPISIIAYAIATLPVDIKAQTIGNIEIDIAAVSHGTIDINIKAQTADVDVNIAASAVTIDIVGEVGALNVGAIINGSFEKDWVGWSKVATSAEWVFDIEQKHTGKQSLEVTKALSATGLIEQILSPAVPTNEILAFTAAVRSEDTSQYFQMRLNYTDGTFKVTSLTLSAADTWETKDIGYDADKYINSILIKPTSPGYTDVALWIDSITMAVRPQRGVIGTVDVDITAQTVGNLGIDIKAQTVGNLNINIAASAVSLNVKTTGAEKVAIDIAAQTIGNVDVNIAAQAANINVDIKAATAKVGITIAAADVTGNIPIDIKAQTVGNVNVDIAAQTVGNIGIDIKAATAKVGITILATDVTGNIPIDIKAQTVGNINIDIAAATAKVGITVNAADVTGNIPIDIKAQTVGNINIDIAAQTVGNINVDIKAQTVDLNIKTSGGVNLVIDKLTQTAYLERRSTLSNNGETALWQTSTGDTRRGKFFPRGCRGFIKTIDVYCKDNAAAGGTITVYISPQPSMGYVASADVTVPAGGGADWRSATFNRMWNYDSLFIFVLGSTSDMRLGYDDDADPDAYVSADAGVTWAVGLFRSWFRAVMKGETVGDLPVSGTINTIEIPSLLTVQDYTLLEKDGVGNVYAPVIVGSGNLLYAMWEVLTDDARDNFAPRLLIDGNITIGGWDFAVFHRLFASAKRDIYLAKWDETLPRYVVVCSIKMPFKRSIQIGFANEAAGVRSGYAWLIAQTIS